MEERSSSITSAEVSRISVIDLLIALAQRKRLFLGIPIAAGAIALVVTFLLPKWYVASAKIMPPQQSQSNAVAILGQLGALAGGPASQALGLKNPSDVYVAILKSRTVADNIIARFDLKRVYDEEYLAEARKELSRNSSIAAGREGVITIEVEDTDPKRAADMANAFIEELRSLTVNLAVGEAAQRRLFFEGQLKKAKNDLSDAEIVLKKFTQQSGLVNPQGQIGLSVAAAAALRAQIAAKEIQMSSMRTFATENNPDLRRTMEELGGLRSELAKMEKDAHAGKGDVMVPFGRAPEVGLEYLRKYRDVKYFETLFEVLGKHYEIARIDEAKDATLIQILDVAVAPERKSKPHRGLIVTATVLIAAMLTLLWLLIGVAVGRATQDPATEAKMRLLRSLATRL
jgi:tyrosine-protein kinase Etk/Wzc